MRFSLLTRSREDFINAGIGFGEAFKSQCQDENPWVVALNGSMNTGKSLIALAIDKAFRPEEYPEGITKRHSADRLYPKKGQETDFPVSFDNYVGEVFATRERLDNAIADFARDCPHSKVLIASNIRRTHSEHFNYNAQGLNSDLLNMNIIVTCKSSGPFWRNMNITVEHEPLIKALQSYLPALTVIS